MPYDKDTWNIVASIINLHLDEREREILYELTFNNSTQEEVGRMFDITNSRIQQIRDKAYEKIRLHYNFLTNS